MLGRFDPRFPLPDEEFASTLMASGVFKPFTRHGSKSFQEGVLAELRQNGKTPYPEELLYLPSYRPDFDTIHHRSLTLEVH